MSLERLSRMPIEAVIGLWRQVMKPCTNAYISPWTLGSSGIIVPLLPGPVISWSKVIKPGTAERCQNRTVFLRVSRRGRVPSHIPWQNHRGKQKDTGEVGPFCLPLLLLKLKTLRCPIFSVSLLAKGAAFLKAQIRSHHPHRTKSKQKNLTEESGLWLLNISPFYSFLMFSDFFFDFHQSAHSLHR